MTILFPTLPAFLELLDLKLFVPYGDVLMRIDAERDVGDHPEEAKLHRSASKSASPSLNSLISPSGFIRRMPTTSWQTWPGSSGKDESLVARRRLRPSSAGQVQC